MAEGGIIILCASYKSLGEGHHLSKVVQPRALYYAKFRASLRLLSARLRGGLVAIWQGMRPVWGMDSLVNEKFEPLGYTTEKPKQH